VVGPQLVSPDLRPQRWDHGERDGWIARVAQRTGNSFWRRRSRPTRAAWIAGAACLVDKRWFDKLGGFDEQFFLYKEDEDFCYRVRAAGGHVVYDPTISVLHHCGVVAKKSDHLRKSTDYFLAKHFKDRVGYAALRWINRVLH
jgi:GT2 family glycosyltransferase